MEGKDPTSVIREALAKALEFYYPFVGRLVEGPNRKLSVDCTTEGVLFIEADANVELDWLGDTVGPRCPYLEELLYDVPGSDGIVGCPLLLIQVTRFSCGGFTFAIRLNHTMTNAPGLVQFLNTIVEFSKQPQTKITPSVPPIWQRHLLSARQPPSITCPHHEYDQALAEPPPPPPRSIALFSLVPKKSEPFATIFRTTTTAQQPSHSNYSLRVYGNVEHAHSA
ncbi:Methanol O-anthraniloyltransferase [Camellia lanceoleosa]|uniref:Methanol O-anthraniloyltransferase n=1 Tax=Camellia lanceoleosa TaxID=1840588 RepID=A0ACC0FJS9_9ERIC|nr:Methanol O-anthraniloyltransferase [Camellia lanceoleosa]